CLPAHGNFTTLFTGLSAPLLMKCTSRLALIPLLLCCAPADAQIEHADGLWKLTTVAYQYYLNDPDTAISLTTQALETALSTQHRYYEGYCYFLLTKAYWVKANYKLSTEYGFKALRLFQDSPHYAEHSNTLIALARDLVEL